MKNKVLIIASLVASLLGSPANAPAQQENRTTPVRFKESGILVEFKTEIEPPQSGIQFEARGITNITGQRNVTHRIFVDQTSGGTFGYDLEVMPSPVANHFILSIKPLSDEKFTVKPMPVKAAPVKAAPVAPLAINGMPVEQVPVETKQRIMRRATKAAGNPNATKAAGSNLTIVTGNGNIDVAMPLAATKAPKFPPAFLIADGGMFALDVLVNPQTGVKIIDVIRISSEANQAAAKISEATQVRDFSPDAIELTVKNFKLLINDQPVLGTTEPVRGGVSGAIIWLYLPGRGRFIFSLTPRESYKFQKVGIVQGNKISFQMAGDRYELISSTPVFSGDWNLWVLHDTEYSPQVELSTPDGYQIGASDRIEYLLKKN